MEQIKISAVVNSRVETIWNAYTSAEDIMQWNQASDAWHCTHSTNDLRIGGKFNHRMEAKDGSSGFDFEGVYTTIEPFRRLTYLMPDGRRVDVQFHEKDNATDVTVVFDPEQDNPIDMQREGWQAILNNFKEYVERVYHTGN